MKEFLNINELSERLNMKKTTLYAMVEGREIPCFRFGRLIRFKKQEIDSWVESHRQEVTEPDRKAKTILREVKNPKMDIDKIVRKSVEEAKEKRYTLENGKPDQVKGLGKEVNNGLV